MQHEVILASAASTPLAQLPATRPTCVRPVSAGPIEFRRFRDVRSHAGWAGERQTARDDPKTIHEHHRTASSDSH
jgi:hypothetical protein